jgi:hypothetical protein
MAGAKPAARTILSVAELSDLYLRHSEREHEPDAFNWHQRYLQSFCDRFGLSKAADLNRPGGDVPEFIFRGIRNRRKDELPLVLGSGSEVHHHDGLANILFGIGRQTAQLADPRPRESIPVRTTQLVPTLIDWHHHLATDR